jgi:nicotinamidase-related amidase
MSAPLHVPDTTPYPWPWSGALTPSRLAVLVVTSPGFGPEPALADSLAAFAGVGALVIEVRTSSPPQRRPGPSNTRVAGSWPADAVVEPHGWDGFHGTPLDGLLRASGRDHLVLTGGWLEIAVHSTMRSANDRGYECLLATDLTVGLDPATTAGAISSIHMSGGIFGATGSASHVLDVLTGAGLPREESLS